MAAIGDSSRNGLHRQQPYSLYNLPVLPLLLAYTAGLITGRFTGVCPPACLVILTVVAPAAAYILYLLIRGKSACLSPLVLFFSLGLLAVSFWQPCNFPPEKAEAFVDAGNVEISGTIGKPPAVENYRTVCILEKLQIQGQSDEPKAVPGRLRASFYGDNPGISPGDRISVQSRIKEFKNFNNPGGFDYSQYMTDQNIWGTLYADTSDLKRPKETSCAVSQLVHAVHRYRGRLDLAVQKAGSGDSAAILSALVVGKRDKIGPELREAFNRAGAGHLLAISGLHVGIVAACSFAVFRLLFLQSQGLLLRGWTVRAAALLTILPVAAYAMISGMSPSTQRAAIMATFFLAAFILEKPYNAANTIAAAALLILSVHPPSLFSISFQLSFAAVSAIFLGVRLFSGFLDFKEGPETQGIGLRILNRVAAFFMISVFAIAGTAPLVMYYFNQAVPAAVISNLILIPWIGFGVVPAGLISAAVFGFSPAAGTWCLSVADGILNPAVSVIRAIAEIPCASFKTVTPSPLEVILAYLLIVCIGLAACRGFRRCSRTVIALSCLAVAATAADAGYWAHRRYFNNALRVTVMDVGQGHASLVEFPGGKTMLIDGGGFPDNNVFDVGRYIVAPCLRAKKIGAIDTVVLSHPDSDHLNGLFYVLENFRVGRIIKGPSEAGTQSWKRFLNFIENSEIRSPDFENTARRLKVNGAEIHLLHPQPEGNGSPKCSGANNNSIVLRVEYRGKSVLFPGDIEKCAESEIVSRAGKMAKSDILIAPHHGSKTSSGPRFLKAVDPDSVIVSARKRGYGPPSEKIIERYKQNGCRVLRTDKKGAAHIRVSPEGKISIESEISRK